MTVKIKLTTGDTLILLFTKHEHVTVTRNNESVHRTSFKTPERAVTWLEGFEAATTAIDPNCERISY